RRRAKSPDLASHEAGRRAYRQGSRRLMVRQPGPVIGRRRNPRMTKRIQAKYKSDRRFGQNLWGRPKSPVNKRQYGPGQHGQRRKGKTSDFGLQLVAKQKLRLYYGNITEKQ